MEPLVRHRRSAIYLLPAERERTGIGAHGIRFERFGATVGELPGTRAVFAAVLGEFDAGVVTVTQLRLRGESMLALDAVPLERLGFEAFYAIPLSCRVQRGDRIDIDCVAGNRLQRLGFAVRVTL